jgi:Flp pilus assembly protein TadD
MTELEPDPGSDVTARLVEQLTKTNERLARLETALREQSLMAKVQSEPVHDIADGSSAALDGDGSAVVHARQPETQPSVAREAEEHFRRGVAYCQMGKYDEALAAWREVLRLQPDNPFALANTGIVYTEQGRWTEAREMFVRVLSLQPDNPDAYYGLGMADAQLGNYAGAISAWENTIRLQPDNADAHYNLILVRQRMAESAANGAAGPPPPETSPSEMVVRSEPAERTPADTGPASSDSGGTSGERAETGRMVRTEVRDWKRIEGSSRKRVAQSSRGAGRLSRPTGSRASRRPLGLLLFGGAIVAAILFVNSNRASIMKLTHFGSQPVRPAPDSAKTVIPKSASIAGPADPTVKKAADVPVQPTPVTVTTQGDNTSVQPLGPPRDGKMQIRLGSGVSGSFQYCFVTRSNRVAPMKWLPRGDRSGTIPLYIPPQYNRPGTQLRVMNAQLGRVARVPIIDVSRPAQFVTPNVGANLLRNSDFQQEPGKTWQLETTAPGRGSMKVADGLSVPAGVVGRSLHFDVAAIGPQGWNVQCYQSGVNLKDREPYLLSFWAKSDKPRPLHIDIILDKPDWHPVGLTNSVKLGAGWQKYLVKFTASKTEPDHTRVSFILGEAVGPVDIAAVTLRPSEGENRTGALQPNAFVTIKARDFN